MDNAVRAYLNAFPTRRFFENGNVLPSFGEPVAVAVGGVGRGAVALRKRRGEGLPRGLSDGRTESRIGLAELPRERGADAEAQPRESDEEDRRDEHVGRVDPSGDVGRIPGTRQALRELPGADGDDGEVDAESHREDARSQLPSHSHPA